MTRFPCILRALAEFAVLALVAFTGWLWLALLSVPA